MSTRRRCTSTGSAAASVSDQSWKHLEAILDDFKQAWQRGERPSLADFLDRAKGPAEQQALLVELVHEDLEERSKAAEAVRVEEYLQRIPALGSNRAELVELIAAEFALRRETGCASDEYLKRFPELGAGLANRLAEAAAPAAPSQAEAPGVTTDDPDATQPEQASVNAGAAGSFALPGYEILGELGRGGMGVVYKARQVKVDRVVALKMILHGGHAGAGELARFKTEAQAIGRMQHPNIVQIHELGEHDGLPFFSLEFCAGGSLAQKLAGAPLVPKQAAALVETLARAMHAAHQQGVIHRDLKPANVLFSPVPSSGGEGSAVRGFSSSPLPGGKEGWGVRGLGIPKITDFGLAKKLDEAGLTATGAIMGTPSYMAPEQAGGKTQELGSACDIYALGAILYNCLTGRPPFQGASILDTLEQVRTHEPVPPSRLQATVPRDLETICLRTLQKEPRQRYAATADLAEDLRRFQAGEPILARPIGKVERLWRWCKRNPHVAVLSACVSMLVLLALGSALAIWRNMARDAETVAETRKIAQERHQRAVGLVKEGNFLGAKNLLRRDDAVLARSAALHDVRAGLKQLQNQVDVYLELMSLSDKAHFACRFGSLEQKSTGRDYCDQFSKILEQVKQGTGSDACGLTPLNEQQQQMLKEDIFDVFLDAGQVEVDLAAGASEEAKKAADKKAIAWFDQAAKILPDTRAVYVRRAASWGRLSNNKAAAADMAKAKSIQPTSAVDRFWHGYAHHIRATLEPQKAGYWLGEEVKEYTAFLLIRPNHFWGYFNYALCKAHLGDRYDAIIGFTNCIRIQPDSPWPFNNRGTMHLQLGGKEHLELALEDYTRALTLDPGYVEALTGRAAAYRLLGKRDLALRDLNAAIKLDSKRAPIYEQRAEWFADGKDFANAIQDLTCAVDMSSDKVSALLRRADVYQHEQVKKYDKARQDFSAVLRLRPDDVEVLRKRAFLTLSHLKDHEKSLADWRVITHKRPKDTQAHYLTGVLLMGLGHYEPAVVEFQKTTALKKDLVQATWGQAQVYLWQGKAQEALALIDPLTHALDPKTPETLNIRGDILRALNRPTEAAADYQKFIDLRPKEPDAYISVALLYGKSGKWEAAKACYDKLLAADPKAGVSYLSRAEFYRNRGLFDEALADCDRASSLVRDSQLPALIRASIVAAQGCHREAVTQADELLQRMPTNDGKVLYAAAAVWSLAAEAAQRDVRNAWSDELHRQYLKRAIALLGQVLGKGFHDLEFPEHNRMLYDPAMAAVCQDPHGRDLLAHKGKD
jgi:serine/threonine protein kinase/Tfp pilus assembly protein PilF